MSLFNVLFVERLMRSGSRWFVSTVHTFHLVSIGVMLVSLRDHYSFYENLEISMSIITLVKILMFKLK